MAANQPSQPNPQPHKKRKIIYYTPPFNAALKTKIGKIFLGLVRKHFPPHHKLYPILNKNTLKTSYSCTANFKQIIQAHNKKVLNKLKNNAPKSTNKCKSQASRKTNCPLNGNCCRQNVVYKATTQGPNQEYYYIGVTENCKARWHQHNQSFKNEELKNATSLSSFVWESSLGAQPNIA